MLCHGPRGRIDRPVGRSCEPAITRTEVIKSTNLVVRTGDAAGPSVFGKWQRRVLRLSSRAGHHGARIVAKRRGRAIS
jgi:hypothetical protein